ncbi:purple acid phosphatase-like [Prunus avium]|uniref:Purple acid phosphatase n=1 Tax=Prunus avium TaxID=42229 RepID=A0A6P5TLE0_PRUAV|nr:purple acid phosphatase-like [Prunus avium]
MAKMVLVSLASASTSSRVAAAIVVVLGLVLSLVVVCNGGKTSSFVRKVEKSEVMPLDSDVFKVPPGYNAPQQVHITQGDQLGKAVIVSWVTVDEPGSNTVVYWSAKGIKEMAVGEVTTYKFYNYTSGYIHHTIISNLNFDTKYHYVVGIDHTKRQFWFITPPEVGPDVPYTFGLIGDLGQTYDSNATLTHYELNPQKGQAVLFVGDLSYADLHPNHDNVRWDTWGRFTERSVAYQPWIWTAGNHDIDFAPEIGEIEPFKPYTHRYPVPHNASGSTSPLWYSIKRASAYIIVLSSYSAYGKYTPQNRWIEEELPKVNRSETPWLIVLMHSPFYNSYTKHYMEGETMRVMYEPSFVKYKVDVVFTGHVHAYERSHRISNVAYNIVNGNCIPVKDQSAPVYITIGDGGNSEGLATNMTEPRPAYSSFREASFGHATFGIKNQTHAYYGWHRNQDGYPVTADSMWFLNRYYNPDDESTSAQHY